MPAHARGEPRQEPQRGTAKTVGVGSGAMLGQGDSTLIGFWEQVFHVSCRCPRDGFAVIPGHHSQRHVDSSGDTCGREQGAFLHKMQSLFDGDFRKQLLHRVEKTPVRGSALAIEEAGFAEQQGAGTNRSQCFNLSRAVGDPLEQTLVMHLMSKTPTTRDEQNVQLRTAVEIVIWNNLHAARRYDGRFGFGNKQGSVAKFDFWGKIQKLGIRNSMTYRLPESRKSNFATEPSAPPDTAGRGATGKHGVWSRGRCRPHP